MRVSEIERLAQTIKATSARLATGSPTPAVTSQVTGIPPLVVDGSGAGNNNDGTFVALWDISRWDGLGKWGS